MQTEKSVAEVLHVCICVKQMNSTGITYVGHATVLIETDKTRILTDPLLRNRIGFLKRQRYTIKTNWYQLIDAVLISHTHRDHFDISSLRLLDNSTRLIVPKDAMQRLKLKGFHNLEVVEVDDCIDIGGVSVKVTPASHHGRLDSLSPTATHTPIGYVIQGNHRIYFPGDTDLFEEMGHLGQDLDVALLPVWGWGPTLGPGHLTPRLAAETLKLLKPSVAIPIHWGTFYPIGIGWLKLSYLIEPPNKFAYHAAQLAPEVEVRIIQPGEQTRLLK